MADFRGKGAGHQLMMDCLIQLGFGQLFLWGGDCAAHEGGIQDRVDLVEGQPVLHLMAIAREDRADITGIEIDELTIQPAVVLLRQMQGRFIMGERH